MAIKVYSLGGHGFVHPKIAQALGTNTQATVLVVALSKKDAAGVLAAHGFEDVNPKDRELTLADEWNTATLLRSAKVLEAGAVYATSLVGHGPVVRILPGGGDEFVWIGDIIFPEGRGYEQRFVVAPDYEPHRPEADDVIRLLHAATRIIREQQAVQRDLIADAVIANAAAAASGVTGLSLSRIYQIHEEVVAERRAAAQGGTR